MAGERGDRKLAVGTVSSDKMDKSIVVSTKRLTMHARYGKYIYRTTKYMAHDEKNEAKAGDLVEIMETRPTSKRKRWRLTKVLERA